MKITGLDVTWVSVPYHVPFTSWYKTDLGSKHVLVRLYTDEGLVGLGEASVGWGVPEAVVAAIKNHLGTVIIGQDPRQPEKLHQIMDEALNGYSQAKNALDHAAYDVTGKAANLPVCALLGGQFRTAVPVCDVVGILSPEETGQAVVAIADKGFKQVKLKAGKDPRRDLEMIKAVKAAVGDRIQLRLDINTGYRSAAQAIPLCKRLEEAGVDMVDQPVRKDDLVGMAKVAAALDIPVVAHESCATYQDAVAIAELRAADVLNVSSSSAGLYRAIQIVRFAESANLPVMVSGASEAGLGTIASAHLAAACREYPFAGDSRTVLRNVSTLVREPIRFEQGDIHLLDGPGFGASFDDEAIEKYQEMPWVRVGT